MCSLAWESILGLNLRCHGVALKRLALLLLLSGCSSTPKTWRPNGFARPPGVPSEVFDRCANSMLSDTGRVMAGAAHEGGFQGLSLYEQDCIRAEYLRACLGEAYRLERAQGLKVRPSAMGWATGWQDFLDDAVDNYCDDQGGGTPGARGLVRVLNDSAEEAGRSCGACAAN